MKNTILSYVCVVVILAMTLNDIQILSAVASPTDNLTD